MVEALFIRLVPYSSVLVGLFDLAGKERLGGLSSVRDITRLLGFSGARMPEVIAGLRAAEATGAVEQGADGLWRVTLSQRDSQDLALLLRGASIYRERVHEDRDTVQVVISKPAEPSQFVTALENTLEGGWGLATTADILGEMAARASTRFSIMTPFVDQDGASRILELFAATRDNVRRELIVREGLPVDLRVRSEELKELGVFLFDFRLSRPDRVDNETFHAKVIRVDNAECYVGSSNMTRWSFWYSLELGFHVTGSAGAQVSRVVDAVLKVSTAIVV